MPYPLHNEPHTVMPSVKPLKRTDINTNRLFTEREIDTITKAINAKVSTVIKEELKKIFKKNQTENQFVTSLVWNRYPEIKPRLKHQVLTYMENGEIYQQVILEDGKWSRDNRILYWCEIPKIGI